MTSIPLGPTESGQIPVHPRHGKATLVGEALAVQQGGGVARRPDRSLAEILRDAGPEETVDLSLSLNACGWMKVEKPVSP